MTANITFNPFLTTNGSGSFDVESTGFMQGTLLDDPAMRNQIAGGTLSSSETLPMWGGVLVSEAVASAYSSTVPGATLGTVVSRALSLASQATQQATGFSVFNQAHAMVNSPQSPVPLSGTYGLVNLVRFGSLSRIAVAMQSGLISVEGELITTNVSWDYSGQQLIPGIAAYASASPSGVTYVSSTGILSLTFGSAPFGASVGTTYDGIPIVVSGISGGAVNGTWPITSTASSGTVINVQATVGLGSLTLTGGTLAAGGGYLSVKVLAVNAGNSMTVLYNPVTGLATWNRSGYAALIQI